ncbi:DUF397 domain-containing protein [Actinomadura alba]|uniref:DUF397 domain-containing protein n=1 Tax=Actinomadura alba TaxID=406431 RepID=A0ABR7LWU0_9ACTN|nr:DUF397 domain-containing protein [Actinomadura alba]MBC6468940.1 DUF397 domain-containing protein [Actinomadura alba]
MNPPELEWRKSRRSGTETACVEVAALPGWRKSSHSGTQTDCVETAALDGAAAVRDSKNPDGPHLAFAPGTWDSFITDVKSGRHDL